MDLLFIIILNFGPTYKTQMKQVQKIPTTNALWDRCRIGIDPIRKSYFTSIRGLLLFKDYDQIILLQLCSQRDHILDRELKSRLEVWNLKIHQD